MFYFIFFHLLCIAPKLKYLLMKNLFIGIMLLCQVTFAQEKKVFDTYNYGQDGIEYIVKTKKSTVIVSTFNAKLNIRQEIAQKIYLLYAENKLESDKVYTIIGDEANVTGNCIIKKKDTLTSIEFFYEKVDWKSGLTELYRNPNNPIISTAIADSD